MLTIAILIVNGMGIKEYNAIHSGETTNEVRPSQHMNDILALASVTGYLLGPLLASHLP